jgi:hypothetical protein
MTEGQVAPTPALLPSALLKTDPPAVGDVVLSGRLGSHDAGTVYAGSVDGADVTVVMLTEGAETDSYARARFRQATSELAAEHPGVILATEDEEDLAPWVAMASTSWLEGDALAGRLMRAVTLEDRPSIGTVTGPDFRPHWWHRVGVGRWRVWPLPWPARLLSAGRWTFVASFALVCAIAALALWLAVQVFQNQVPPPPGPGPGPGPLPPPSPTSPSPTPTPSPIPGQQQGPTGAPPAPPIV